MNTLNALVCAAVLLAACGPSPRPVPPSLGNAWPTALGNERRAAFENEPIRDSMRVVWDANAGAGMRASILVSDSAVFAGTTNRLLLAFGTRNGRRFWDQHLEGEIPGDLVRAGRTLFLVTAETNGSVHARDMQRGRAVWRHTIGPSSVGPMLDGKVLYAANDRGQVFALRTDDGSQLWRAQVGGRVSALPVNAGDAVIVATARDTLYRVAKRDGSISARGLIESSVAAPMAVAGDTLVLATYSGAVLGVSATSLKTLWKVDTGAAVTAAPIISADGVIHVLNRNAEIWRIVAGRGQRIAAFGGAAAGAFTLARGRYIVGELDGTLIIADLEGHVLAQHKFNDSLATPAAVQAGAVYVPFRHGRIVKLQ